MQIHLKKLGQHDKSCIFKTIHRKQHDCAGVSYSSSVYTALRVGTSQETKKLNKSQHYVNDEATTMTNDFSVLLFTVAIVDVWISQGQVKSRWLKWQVTLAVNKKSEDEWINQDMITLFY